jgi:hypothetical protein
MLYYMYNTTTRLTFIPFLLIVMGMYNPRRKWVWNSHIYTVPWSYLVVCRVVHTHHHEEEGDKRQSSCCIIYVVEHTIRSDQETVYIWLFHTHFLLGLYIPITMRQQLDWRLSPSSSLWWVCTTLGGSGYGIVIYTLFPGLIWSYALLHI